MADGGAASQDESSGPGNDYSILHIHIQTVLLAMCDERSADKTHVELSGEEVFSHVAVHTQLANCNLTEEETSYWKHASPPPFVRLDGCTPLHIHTSADKYNLAYFISNRRREPGFVHDTFRHFAKAI